MCEITKGAGGWPKYEKLSEGGGGGENPPKMCEIIFERSLIFCAPTYKDGGKQYFPPPSAGGIPANISAAEPSQVMCQGDVVLTS